MDNCIFCLIATKKIISQIVYENDDILAFHDLNAQAPVHILVIPKRHIDSLATAVREDEAMLGRLLLATATVGELAGVTPSGYRVIVNNGSDAGQSVGHLHLHVLGGRALAWPPG